MTDETPKKPKPTAMQRLFGYNEDTPMGEWQMLQFIEAFRRGERNDETNQYFFEAFTGILSDLNQAKKNKGAIKSGEILKKHLPLTSGKRGPIKQKRDIAFYKRSAPWNQAWDVELAKYEKRMKPEAAYEKVAKDHRVTPRHVAENYSSHKGKTQFLIAQHRFAKEVWAEMTDAEKDEFIATERTSNIELQRLIVEIDKDLPK